jgi:hypothetical protein
MPPFAFEESVVNSLREILPRSKADRYFVGRRCSLNRISRKSPNTLAPPVTAAVPSLTPSKGW